MKKMFLSLVSTLSVCAILTATAGDSVVPEVDDVSEFHSFLRKFEEGTERFINGDPTLWLQHVTPRGDASIMGGFGGYEQGKEVGARYKWAAEQFRPSGAALKVEYVTSAVGADLAYTVSIERSQALVAGQAAAMAMALRVTHVFRKEHGVWRLLHRHADHLVEKTAPSAVLRTPNNQQRD
jgi:hypothetical protein